MSFTMSFDPSAAFRAAMEEQLARIDQTIKAIEPSDADANEMRKRLEVQADDLRRRLKTTITTRATSTSIAAAETTPVSTLPAASPRLMPTSESDEASRLKEEIRVEIWPRLRKVALPDSRFDYDFKSFIPDFLGSSLAIARLTTLTIYKEAQFMFITADNSLEGLRRRALQDGKLLLTMTYRMRRGFYLLDPVAIPQSLWEGACMLDGVERFGRAVSLSNVMAMQRKIDVMVTGATGVDCFGWLIGTGSGCFDLASGILYTASLVSDQTPSVAIVHDCQVSEEDYLPLAIGDVHCGTIITPSRTLTHENGPDTRGGIEWKDLADEMMEDIPTLREAKSMIETGQIDQVWA